MAKKKAVAKKDQNELTKDSLAMMQEDAGQGMDFGKDDLAIPFIRICQATSPQRKKKDPKYIDGIEDGHLFNTVLEVSYGEEVRVIPVAYEKVYNEWIDRDEGGGFVATYPNAQEAAENAAPENDVVETANHYVLIQDPNTGAWSQAIVTIKSSGLKVSRKWNSMVSMRKVEGPEGPFTPPAYAQVFTLSTVEESNDLGDWWNFQVKPDCLVPELPNGEQVYQAAKDFRNLIQEGAARADFRKYEPESDVDEDDNPDF